MTLKLAAGPGLGLLLFILLGPGVRNGPVLMSPGVNGVTDGEPRIHRGDTVTIGSMFGCLDSPGSVTITDIAPTGGIGLEVTGWAVRPNPYWKPPGADRPGPEGQIGVARTTLARLQLPSSRVVDAECGRNGEGFEFAAEVRKTTDGEAGASGWVVTYTSDGVTRTMSFPLAVRLCNDDKAWAKPCLALRV